METGSNFRPEREPKFYLFEFLNTKTGEVGKTLQMTVKAAARINGGLQRVGSLYRWVTPNKDLTA